MSRELKDIQRDESGSVNFFMTYYYDGKANNLSIGGRIMIAKNGILTDAIITEARTSLVGLLTIMKERYGE